MLYIIMVIGYGGTKLILEEDKIMMIIDVGDVIKLKDGDIYEVTGVISDREYVYFYQEGDEVSVSFIEVDTLYKPQ